MVAEKHTAPKKHLKKYALNPAERLKECDHEMGFRYSGRIPCTGARVCLMCGAREEEVRQEEVRQEEDGDDKGVAS